VQDLLRLLRRPHAEDTPCDCTFLVYAQDTLFTPSIIPSVDPPPPLSSNTNQHDASSAVESAGPRSFFVNAIRSIFSIKFRRQSPIVHEPTSRSKPTVPEEMSGRRLYGFSCNLSREEGVAQHLLVSENSIPSYLTTAHSILVDLPYIPSASPSARVLSMDQKQSSRSSLSDVNILQNFHGCHFLWFTSSEEEVLTSPVVLFEDIERLARTGRKESMATCNAVDILNGLQIISDVIVGLQIFFSSSPT